MRFVVIEGIDGAGKSTQIRLLLNYLDSTKLPYKYLHFPRTDSPVFGDLIARFLKGDFGEIGSVNPYLVALIYAGDRNDAKKMITGWLKKGFYVIADRYVNSNIAFQCAKLKDHQARISLKKWILNLEYDYYRIPKPDVNFFLDVPFEFTIRKLTGKRYGDDRNYLSGQRDIHEQSLGFQKNVREVYLEISADDTNFIRIDCGDHKNRILPPEVIFRKIINLLNL